MTGAAVADLGLSGDAPALPPDDAARTNAAAELERLKGDSEWTRRHLAGDHTTKADVARLASIIAAPRAGTTLHGGPTIEAQRAEMADYVEAQGLSPAIVAQVRSGIPETAMTYKQAVGLKRQLVADPGFREKYFRGDADARERMLKIDIILSGPISL
jgi:hypothetical protein